MSRTVKIECGISFRLRETGANKPTPVTCFVEYNGKPVVKIPTGTKVHPIKWNPEKERPIGGLKGLESAEANAIVEKLATIRATVESEYRTYVNKFQSYPDKAIFKEQVIGLLAGATTVKASDPSQSLISFFDRQVKLSREGKRTVLKGKRAGMRYRENTIRSYEGSRMLLQEYVEHRKLKRLNFDNVTMDFYYDLRDYMFTYRSFSLNYFATENKDDRRASHYGQTATIYHYGCCIDTYIGTFSFRQLPALAGELGSARQRYQNPDGEVTISAGIIGYRFHLQQQSQTN